MQYVCIRVSLLLRALHRKVIRGNIPSIARMSLYPNELRFGPLLLPLI
jgi:hypothetical protein